MNLLSMEIDGDGDGDGDGDEAMLKRELHLGRFQGDIWLRF